MPSHDEVLATIREQLIANACELRDGTVRVSGTDVEIAECVDGANVARLILDQPHVLFNGPFELSLAKKLLRLLECGLAIYGHLLPAEQGKGGTRDLLHRIKQ